MKHHREDEFKGRVKFAKIERTTEMQLQGQSVAASLYRTSSTFEFDKNGNKIKINHYDSDDKVTTQILYEYHENGQLSYEKSVGNKFSLNGETFYANGQPSEFRFYDAESKLRSTSRYLYDTKNRLVYSAAFNTNGTLASKTEVVYDRTGGRVETSMLDEFLHNSNWHDFIKDANGFKIDLHVEGAHHFKVKYGADNNPTAAAYYDARGNLIKKYEFDYSATGFIKESRNFELASSQHGEIRLPGILSNAFFSAVAIYEYAKQGDLRQSVESVFDLPLVRRNVYKFADGRLTDRFDYLFGRLSTHERLEYDEKGELQRETHYLNDDNKFSIFMRKSFIREFDEFGNWTKQVVIEDPAAGYKNAKVTTSTSRNIEYFD